MTISRWLLSVPLAILCRPAAPLSAQTASFHNPISGFVYSPASQAVLPVLGVPGAAQLGAPVLKKVEFASIAPNGDWALVSHTGRSSLLHGLAALAPVRFPANGLLEAVDRVVWNRDGSFALLYSSSQNRLQRVSVSAAGVTADAPVDLSPWGVAASLAIDPAGRQVAFGVTGSGVYLFAPGQFPARLAPLAQPAAASFDGSGQRLYVADAAQQQIFAFDSGSSALSFASLAQAGAPAVMPVGLTVSGDGRYLLLADRAARNVRAYDTASAALVTSVALDFAPSRFEALSTAPTILLNGDNPAEWLLVLDARQLPAVSFVPAASRGAVQ